MATITKLESGKLSVRVRRQGHKLITKTFILKADADRWARQVESDLDRGVFVNRSEAERTTLGEALERYRLEVTPTKKTAANESRLINQWRRHPLANRSLATLNPLDFSSYRDSRLALVKEQTVRHELALISNLFNIARREWSIPISNPLDSIKKPRQSKPRTRRLEGDEEQRLIAACKSSSNAQLFPLITLALETAMRLSEMLSLTWTEVNIQQCTLTKSVTKNGDSRTIPLTKAAVQALLSVPKAIHTDRVFYIWACRPDAIKTSWKTALIKAGIGDFHFHDLRHEAITRLFELGLNQFEVAAISGHKTMQMLARYTHLRASDLLKKMERAD